MRDGMRYRTVTDENNRTWIIPLCVDAADHIHVTESGNLPAKGNRSFAGYGGATLKFELEDGSIFEAHGPWHSNSEGLFEATGLNIRSLHMTKVVVGSERTKYGEPPMDDLYSEKAAVLGSFHRGNQIAQAIADVLQRDVVLDVKSAGGGLNAIVSPSRVPVH